jgi:hypothetical protein
MASPRPHNPNPSWPHFFSKSEMEFLDINLTKDCRVFYFHAIHSLFTGLFLKKTSFYSGFKHTYKKIRDTRKLESIRE